MDSDSSFIISPMTQRISLMAGEEYHSSITVANPTDATKDFVYKVAVSPYSVKGDKYSADFVTESDYTKIKDWITVDNPTGTIEPGKSTKVTYTIRVPEDAPAGGQYGALLVSSGSEIGGDDVAVKNVFEMACVIYAEVAGETKHVGEVTRNEVPGYVANVPFGVSSAVKNEGNVHEIARVSVEVRNIFSDDLIYPKSNESGVVEETIMPNTARDINRTIDGVSPLGIYVVKQSVEYLGETSVVEKTVFACPIWFMVLVFATICSIIYSIVKTIRKKHRRKVMFE